jgi:hypothetical protein
MVNVIVVSPSGVFPVSSQKEFAIATYLPRNHLVAHARMIVDAAITQAHEHYGCYCKALALKEQAHGAHSKYNVVEQEFDEQWRDMEVIDSIRDVDVCEEGAELSKEDGAMTAIEIRKASEIEQEVRDYTGLYGIYSHAAGQTSS